MIMTQLYRTQILLEREQHESLQQLAAAAGRSMSEVIREAVAVYLVDHSKEWKRQQALDAIARMSELRQQLVAEYGIFEGDLLAEAREERDADMERVWRGEA
jgi:predicted DNA-binding protein